MSEIAKEYGTADRQRELLSMLKQLSNILSENGIQFSLAGGTLLGAVRDNGFIPWDDDVDIMVDRNNFKKIKVLFNQQGDSFPFEMRRILWIERIQKKGYNKSLFSPTIDIFVMDNCPDQFFLRKMKVCIIKVLQGMMKDELNLEEKSVIHKMCLYITHLMGKPFSEDRKYSWYDRIAQIGNQKKTRYITGYTDAFNLLNLRYTGNLFNSYIETKFEDTSFPIITEFENYLKTQYGDYMTPVPWDERKHNHI